jgi:hypothetical protein
MGFEHRADAERFLEDLGARLSGDLCRIKEPGFKQRLCYLLLKKTSYPQAVPSAHSALLARGGRTPSSRARPDPGFLVRGDRRDVALSLNNGITEGFHNKMELINRQAYGFRNFQNYRLRVKVLCG